MSRESFDNSREYSLKNLIVKTRAARGAAMLALFLPRIVAAQATAAYERRGHAVEAHRQAMQAAIDALRSSVLDTLRTAAPDLVAQLDPAPPPVAQGYQLLPRLLPDARPPVDTARRASLYSWPWTDTLIARGNRRIDELRGALARPARQRADLERLVSEFNGIVADRRLIDAHIEHNWFWQRAIAADTARFARASRAIDSALRGVGPPPVTMPAMPRVEIMLDDSGRGPITIRVPIVTDIVDTTLARSVKATIENLWDARVGDREYLVRLEVRFISPRELYCGVRPGGCVPPAQGARLDLPGHLARFPAGIAVLTTGGTQPYVQDGKSMILGPRDVTPRTLAHELGHLLGFDDAYLRGYRPLGEDGYAIIEFIPDRADLMASSGAGEVLPRHMVQLVANLRADRAMKAGLHAMYDRHSPREAVPLFREALTNREDHYGATFQLAKALDQSGDSVAATAVWQRALAVAQHDSATVALVRARVGVP